MMLLGLLLYFLLLFRCARTAKFDPDLVLIDEIVDDILSHKRFSDPNVAAFLFLERPPETRLANLPDCFRKLDRQRIKPLKAEILNQLYLKDRFMNEMLVPGNLLAGLGGLPREESLDNIDMDTFRCFAKIYTGQRLNPVALLPCLVHLPEIRELLVPELEASPAVHVWDFLVIRSRFREVMNIQLKVWLDGLQALSEVISSAFIGPHADKVLAEMPELVCVNELAELIAICRPDARLRLLNSIADKVGAQTLRQLLALLAFHLSLDNLGYEPMVGEEADDPRQDQLSSVIADLKFPMLSEEVQVTIMQIFEHHRPAQILHLPLQTLSLWPKPHCVFVRSALRILKNLFLPYAGDGHVILLQFCSPVRVAAYIDALWSAGEEDEAMQWAQLLVNKFGFEQMTSGKGKECWSVTPMARPTPTTPFQTLALSDTSFAPEPFIDLGVKLPATLGSSALKFAAFGVITDLRAFMAAFAARDTPRRHHMPELFRRLFLFLLGYVDGLNGEEVQFIRNQLALHRTHFPFKWLFAAVEHLERLFAQRGSLGEGDPSFTNSWMQLLRLNWVPLKLLGSPKVAIHLPPNSYDFPEQGSAISENGTVPLAVELVSHSVVFGISSFGFLSPPQRHAFATFLKINYPILICNLELQRERIRAAWKQKTLSGGLTPRQARALELNVLLGSPQVISRRWLLEYYLTEEEILESFSTATDQSPSPVYRLFEGLCTPTLFSSDHRTSQVALKRRCASLVKLAIKQPCSSLSESCLAKVASRIGMSESHLGWLRDERDMIDVILNDIRRSIYKSTPSSSSSSSSSSYFSLVHQYTQAVSSWLVFGQSEDPHWVLFMLPEDTLAILSFGLDQKGCDYAVIRKLIGSLSGSSRWLMLRDLVRRMYKEPNSQYLKWLIATVLNLPTVIIEGCLKDVPTELIDEPDNYYSWDPSSAAFSPPPNASVEENEKVWKMFGSPSHRGYSLYWGFLETLSENRVQGIPSLRELLRDLILVRWWDVRDYRKTVAVVKALCAKSTVLKPNEVFARIIGKEAADSIEELKSE